MSLSKLLCFLLLTLPALVLAQGDNTPDYLTKARADSLYDGLGAADRWVFAYPPNWTGFRPSFTIYEDRRGAFTTDINPDALRPAGYENYTVYYVDPVAGKDRNNGLTKAQAFRRIATALAMPGDKWILCRPGSYNLATNMNGVQPSGNVMVEPWDETGYIISSNDFGALNWSGSNGVYTAATPTSPALVVDESKTDAWGNGLRYRSVSTLAECQSRPGTFFVAGPSSIAVHTHDNRMPDSRVLVFSGGGNGRYMAGGNYWARRVVWRGGFTPFAATSTTGTQNVTLVDCAAIYSIDNRDGFGFDGAGSALLLRCYAGANGSDGFDYRNARKYVEVDCRGVANGYDETNADNGSTAHYSCQGIRIGGTYMGNRGPNIHDIGNSIGLLLGCQVGASTGWVHMSADIAAGQPVPLEVTDPGVDSTTLWAIGVRYELGSTYARACHSLGRIFYRRHATTRPDYVWPTNSTSYRPI